MNSITFYLFFLVILLGASCVTKPKGSFNDANFGRKPDYSLEKNWAALPWIEDNADKTPGDLEDKQETAGADVFYLYPTFYFGKKEWDDWNPAIDNAELNNSIDETALTYQASAFNKAGKIYAPRYRQAHYYAYGHKDSLNAKKAFDLAYQDVKEAFGYYLSHWNKGRPIIIASHSQGTTHAKRLLEEFFDGKPLEKRLVVAYLIGIPVDLDRFDSLKPCENEYDTGCLVGWRTWKKGSKPKLLEKEKKYNVLITNPLSWNSDTHYVGKEKHKGAVLFDFDNPVPQSQSAEIHQSILWTDRPSFKGSIFYTARNYHRGDINLFYLNIRDNAAERVSVFTKNL